ncbi:retrovirus-related pol polyprotein from transposon TNT 1-94 [Tanacetum coccineum]
MLTVTLSLSQELLDMCLAPVPMVFNQQDKMHAHNLGKKQVTVVDQLQHQVVLSQTCRANCTLSSLSPCASLFRVNSCTDASGSQPRSILKKHKIPPAKSDSMKKVEEHPRTIRSSLKTTNRVDSSISSKRTVVQIVLWYLDSGCSKHMTGDRSRLMNFVKKFIGTVRFGNDHFGAIMGYGDYVVGDSVISRVYYVEGLGHNLFSVGQFCDSDLEVAFRKHSCYVRDTDGVELLKGSRGSNLYTISVEDMMKSSPICLLSKASKHKSWLWHRRLNHLNFGTINDLARKDLVRGLPRLNAKDSTAERRGRKTEPISLVEVSCGTMLIPFPRHDVFLWADARGYCLVTPQNRSVLTHVSDKTPYELVHNKKPDLTFYLVIQSRTRSYTLLTPGPISSGLVPNPAPAIPYVPPTNKELEMLFQPMFDEYFNPPGIRQDPIPNVAQDPGGSNMRVKSRLRRIDPEPFVNVFAPDYNSEASSSGEITIPESNQSTLPHEHIRKWTDSHPLDNIIGNPSRPVSTRKQLATDALWCFYNSVLSKVEPKNFKSAVNEMLVSSHVKTNS